jgi:5-(carboxyamino)imidazole ribonucleotide synthase
LHRGGILSISTAPAFGEGLQDQAETMIRSLLDHLGYTGVMALELFLVGDRLLANEFAPRVHNSGHWTIDGACTSQFENHLRAICGLPLGDTDIRFRSLMFNLLGKMPDVALQASPDTAASASVHWHDYHKTPRENRKIGHVTVTANTAAALQARSAQLASALGVAAELDLGAVMAETGQ